MVRGDVEFIDEERNFISLSNHVLFCLLYKHLTNKKKPTLFMFKKKASPFSYGAK